MSIVNELVLDNQSVSSSLQFFEHVYRGWGDGYLVLWMLLKDGKTKKSFCFSSNQILDAAGEAIAHHEDGVEIFFGVGLQKNRVRSPLRGSEDTVVAIPGLWCDIDFADSEGKGKKKYPTAKFAYEKLRSMPLQPSVMVQSGGGIHPYWLFESLNYLGSEEERAHAKQLSLRWQEYLRSQFRGKALDSTHDLSRVLRPPGSWSHRHSVEVQIAEQYRDPDRWRRYEIGQVEEILKLAGIVTGDEAGKEKTGASVRIPFDLKKNDHPDRQMLEALLANNHQFRRTWEYRNDKFESQSEYDLSLASHAANAGWEDDEIAKLLITHRAKHAPDSMSKVLERKDYLEKTIRKARETSKRTTEPAESRSHELGECRIEVMGSRRTPTKTMAGLHVHVNGDVHVMDVSTAASSQTSVAKKLSTLAGCEPNEAEAILGRILAEADEAERRPPTGDTIQSVVAAYVKEQGFVAVDDKLRLIDENGRAYSHQSFVAALKTEELISRLSQASDAPRNEFRHLMRNQIASRLNQELAFAFASLFQKLKDSEQTQLEFGDNIRGAIIAAFCAPVSMGLQKQSITTVPGETESFQIEAKKSLAQVVAEIMGDFRTRSDEKWLRIAGSFSAWFRVTVIDEKLPRVLHLAMREMLFRQTFVRTDWGTYEKFSRAARAAGCLAEAPQVPDRLITGRGDRTNKGQEGTEGPDGRDRRRTRIAVLSADLVDEIHDLGR